MRILVTGGAGDVGMTVLDNLMCIDKLLKLGCNVSVSLGEGIAELGRACGVQNFKTP